jgi:hypothetical protein
MSLPASLYQGKYDAKATYSEPLLCLEWVMANWYNLAQIWLCGSTMSQRPNQIRMLANLGVLSPSRK